MMNTVAENLFEDMMLLSQELRRRFDNAAAVKDDEAKSIGDQIKDAALRYGYCQGMHHAMMLLAQLDVKGNIPDVKDYPKIPVARKPDDNAVLPKADEEPLPKAEYEGDYVTVKGKKYYANDILELISEASILNPEMTKQGKALDTKIGKCRAMFPGMTDDEVIGIDFKTLDKEHREARSKIRDYVEKRKCQARTKAALMRAENGHD